MSEPDLTFIIGERAGFTPRIGVLASQLASARHFLLQATRDLSVAQLDAVPAGAVNTIGMLLAHLAAGERFFWCLTFEGRHFDDDEKARWWPRFRFEDEARTRGRPLGSYLADLEASRQATLAALATRDDGWLDTETSFFGRPANVHYYWFHYLQDEVRHTGQINLIRKHLIGADPGFNPYG